VISLDCDWTVGDTELSVKYRLTNRHPAAAFAYSVPRTARRLEQYPGAAYARLLNDDTELTLLLGTCAPPAEMQVPVCVQPLAVLIPPGRAHAGEVRLPVPVPEWDAYSPPDDPARAGRPVGVYVVHLVVEYVLERETYFSQETPDGGRWDVGGKPVRRVSATFVPDNRLPVIGKPTD
jgi:hypothetical protein